MTRHELVRWTMWEHERSALVQQAKLDAPTVWDEAQVKVLVAEGYPPWRGNGWARPIAEAAMELAAICAGFLSTPAADYLGERIFFHSTFERDAWLAQHQAQKS